jgi:N-acyl-D-amino-acid deacylase
VRGERLSVPEAVKTLTSNTASTFGLLDRGVVAPGYRADLNLIDYDALRLYAPIVTYDLPAGGRRLVQKADGYVATIVNGVFVYKNGEATGLLPGKVIRGAPPQPAENEQTVITA